MSRSTLAWQYFQIVQGLLDSGVAAVGLHKTRLLYYWFKQEAKIDVW